MSQPTDVESEVARMIIGELLIALPQDEVQVGNLLRLQAANPAAVALALCVR